jgi:UDP-N-acetylmuramyl pentapeptide phosphotransferase/UDP-N-acetylglucosamine-1-phosphate transferase
MSATFDPAFFIVPGIAFLLSLSVTRLAIRYAHRRQLIDNPGRRRSHDVPTPRGGGIGIVVAVAASLTMALAAAGSWLERRHVSCILAGMLIVAFVGWLDDHRALGVLPRLAAHLLAASLFAAATVFPLGILLPWSLVLVVATLMLSIVWSINLHNFMDGIDGLLASQALFVMLTFAAMAHAGDGGDFALTMVVAAAVAGFLPSNAPRATIFMGDVGSGTLGFLIAAAAWLGIAHGTLTVAAVLIACSAFLTDATCTLLSRMLRGRRWYSAHREHLYQWLVRSGVSHAGAVAWYMGWNLLVALPVVVWMNRMPRSPMPAGMATVAVYATAIATWWMGKRWCLRRAHERSVHAAA